LHCQRLRQNHQEHRWALSDQQSVDNQLVD
jgi:hypothetical protein